MAVAEPLPVAFGRFVLEPDGRLVRGRATAPLPPKESALLRMLAEAEGRLVSKQEIFDRLWPREDVGEASITRCVRGLRRAFGENGRRGGAIETLHGRGYRLALPVLSRLPPNAAHRDGALRIAVAPFENVTPEGESEYLTTGIAGELTSGLAQLRADRVAVIARQSSERLRRGDPKLLSVARELRLDFLVTGWLGYENSRLRVHVELVRVRDDVLIWSATFQRPKNRLRHLAGEIVQQIADALGQSRPARTHAEPEHRAGLRSKSHLALLQGQHVSRLRTENGIRRSIELFEQAIAWDPGNAEAHAAIADANLFLGIRGYAAPREIAPAVRESVARALALDRRLGSALCARAYLRSAIDYDPQAALADLALANTTMPGNSRVEWLTGQIHMCGGRFTEALAACEASVDLDPFSPSTGINVPYTLWCADRLDEAFVAARELASREPEFGLGVALRGAIAGVLGRRSEAIRCAELAETLARGDQLTLSGCAWVLASAGRTEHAAAIRAALERKATRRHVSPTYLAVAALGLRDTERAIAWLERGLEQRCMFLPFLAVDPRFAHLREDARFRAIAAAALGQGATRRARRATPRQPVEAGWLPLGRSAGISADQNSVRT